MIFHNVWAKYSQWLSGGLGGFLDKLFSFKARHEILVTQLSLILTVQFLYTT